MWEVMDLRTRSCDLGINPLFSYLTVKGSYVQPPKSALWVLSMPATIQKRNSSAHELATSAICLK